MHRLIIETSFPASHALRMPDGRTEPVHEHDWKVEVTVASETLDAWDMVMDFHELETIVGRAAERWRGVNLSEHADFSQVNASAERVAEALYQRIAAALPQGVRLGGVMVTEAPGCRAVHEPS